MGNRLDQRETVFTRSDFTLEERRKTLDRTVRRGEMRTQAIKRAMVIVDQLTDACGKTGKGELVHPKTI